MEDTVEVRLQKLTKKTKELETKKIGMEKELELLKEQHSALIAELNSKGINDIENLDSYIESLEAEFNQELTNAEKEIEEIERKLTSF